MNIFKITIQQHSLASLLLLILEIWRDKLNKHISNHNSKTRAQRGFACDSYTFDFENMQRKTQ